MFSVRCECECESIFSRRRFVREGSLPPGFRSSRRRNTLVCIKLPESQVPLTKNE